MSPFSEKMSCISNTCTSTCTCVRQVNRFKNIRHSVSDGPWYMAISGLDIPISEENIFVFRETFLCFCSYKEDHAQVSWWRKKNFILLYEAASCSCHTATQQSGSQPSVDHMSNSSFHRIGQGNHLFEGKEGNLVPLCPLFPHSSAMFCSCERWCCYWKVMYQQLGIKEKKPEGTFQLIKILWAEKCLWGCCLTVILET